MARSYSSFANAFDSALGNVTRAQDAAIKRKLLSEQIQAASFANDQNIAARELANLQANGLIELNPETGTYDLTGDALGKFFSSDQRTRDYVFNFNTNLNKYIETNVGEGLQAGKIGNPMPLVNNKKGERLVPTSLLRNLEIAQESGNQSSIDQATQAIEAWRDPSNTNPVYMIPIERKDGKFSFFTRDRTDRADDQTLLITGSELGTLLQGRINSIYTAINPTASRSAMTLSQDDVQQTLGITGTGSQGVTTDTLMDQLSGQSAFNTVDDPNSKLSGADQSDALSNAVGLLQQGINDDILRQWDEYQASGSTQPSVLPASSGYKGQIPDGITNSELLKEMMPGGKYDFYTLNAEDQREVLNRLGGNALGARIGLNKKLQDELRNSGNVPVRKVETDSVDKRAINQYRAQFGGAVINMTDDEVAEQIRKSNSPRFAKYKQPRTEIKLDDSGQDLTKAQFIDGVDMSQYPDLSKVTSKQTAMELINSGNLQSFMSDDLIAKYKTKLEEENVTDATSFNKAVQERRIENPYIASLVIANAIAGPDTSDADVQNLATSLVNNIMTGDPGTDSGDLVQIADRVITTRNDFLKWRAEQSTEYLDDLKDQTADISKQWDNFQLAFKDGDPQNTYTNALSSTLGLLDQLKQNGYSDTLVALKNLDPTLTRKVGDGISRAIYQQLGSNWNVFTKDFWGDIPAPNDPAALGGYMERLAFRKNADGEIVELVRTKNVIGGKRGTIMVESEGSADMQTVVDRLNPETLNILKRFIPTLGPENFKDSK